MLKFYLICTVNIALEYINYLFKAKGRHGTHSPFIYDIVNECLTANIDKNFLLERKKLFKDLKKSTQSIEITDFGSGSKRLSNKRKISSIFKISSSKGKFGILLYRLNKHYKFNHILELGTSLGVGSFHLAKGYEKSQIISVEGCIQTYKEAKNNLKSCSNVNLINSTFSEFISHFNHPKYDLIFIDGHHDGTALKKYIELLEPYTHNDTFYILDDIRWSNSMFDSWNEIKSLNKFNVTIDFFRMGITVKRNQQFKEHFTLKI